MKAEFIPHTPMKLLLEPHYFDFNNSKLKIPSGFAFDGASIPRIFSFLLKPNDTDSLIAWLEHDFLYSNISWEVKRKDADILFMLKLSPLLTRLFVYIWVRTWGWYSFKRDRNYQKYKIQIEKARKNHKLTSLTKQLWIR